MRRPPKLRLTRREFYDLLEYSCSLPSGTTPGKRWRRLYQWREAVVSSHPSVGCGVDALTPSVEIVIRSKWWVGEYGQPTGNQVPITWYEPVIVCESGEGLPVRKTAIEEARGC